jgi:RNA polymerase sigma factor (sigma-70 family)
LSGVDDDVTYRGPDLPVCTVVGSPGSFEAFYADHYAETVRLAGFLSGSRVVAEDLAQDAFVRLEDKFARLDNPAGYLRTTVVNLCRNRRRASDREASRLVRHGASPSTVSDRAAELDATLWRLPFRERAVVVLRYWLGLSEAEIAQHLGCRPGTVKSRHARALVKIRKELS